MAHDVSKILAARPTAFFDGSDPWKPANQQQHPTSLEGQILSPQQMGVSWETLPGNQPATNGNLLAVWQNPGNGIIPYGQTPLQKQSIIKDEPSGNQIFEFPIQSKPYVVAYGTSDTGTAWASTLQFTPGQGGQGKPLLVSIEVNAVNTDSLSAKFTTPFGNIPSANKNWMGLWEGPIVTFDGSNRIKKVDVGASQNIDFQSMSGLNLTINTTYSLGYGVGPKDSDLAAWVSFTTVPF